MKQKSLIAKIWKNQIYCADNFTQNTKYCQKFFQKCQEISFWSRDFGGLILKQKCVRNIFKKFLCSKIAKKICRNEKRKFSRQEWFLERLICFTQVTNFIFAKPKNTAKISWLSWRATLEFCQENDFCRMKMKICDEKKSRNFCKKDLEKIQEITPLSVTKKIFLRPLSNFRRKFYFLGMIKKFQKKSCQKNFQIFKQCE